jgi:hypothetical protein
MISSLAVLGLIIMLALPAHAASHQTTTGTLYGTSDYIETDTWIGVASDLNFQSSSWLWGTNPENAYLIQDSNVITANGVAVTLGNTGGSATSSSSSATYQCTSYDNWYCGNAGSNLSVSWWSWSVTTQDTTTVQVYSSSAQKFYNGDGATIIW